MTNMPVALQEDNPPYIDFKHDVVEDRNRSISEGRYIAKDVEVVILTPHGDNKNITEEYVDRWIGNLRERLKNKSISQRFYDHCMDCYAAWKEKGEIPLNGTPIIGWAVLSPAQQKSVIDANIRTVEDLAVCTEEGMANIGMGARGLKSKAQTWMQSANDHGVVTQRIDALEAELVTAKSMNESLLEKVQHLEQATQATNTKPKRGRPLKDA